MEKAPGLLEDRSHSVLLAGVTLMLDICSMEPATAEAYRRHVPLLCKILRSLIMGGFVPGASRAGRAGQLAGCEGQLVSWVWEPWDGRGSCGRLGGAVHMGLLYMYSQESARA